QVAVGVLRDGTYLALGQPIARGELQEAVLLGPGGHGQAYRHDQGRGPWAPPYRTHQNVLMSPRNSVSRRRDTAIMVPLSSTAILPSARLKPARCARLMMYDLCTRKNDLGSRLFSNTRICLLLSERLPFTRCTVV